MTFNEFLIELKPLIVFNTQDIFKSFPKFNQVNLTNWQKKKLIVKLARGFYTFSDTNIDKNLHYFTANKIIDPSYISCQSALAYYKVIHSYEKITSVSPSYSYEYKSGLTFFKYHKIGDSDLISELQLIRTDNYFFKIASLEKAIVDFFFFNPQFQAKFQVQKLNFNKDTIYSDVDIEKLKSITEDYDNELLKTRINNFIKIFYRRNP